MSVLIGILADPHVSEQPNRINYYNLLKRKMWQHIDAAGRSEIRTIFRPTSHDLRALNASAEFFRSLAQELDLLIFLGDLATTGQSPDVMTARQIFADPSAKRHIGAKILPAFGGLGIPMHFVPGNHDRYKDDFGTPGSTVFDAAFAEYYQPKISVCDQTIRSGDVTLGVISADFCYRDGEAVGRMKKLGWGRANPVVLGELDRRTARWKDQNPGKPVIWAIHFSPSESAAPSIQLENRLDVIELANKLDVRHIFFGHTHDRRREIGSHPHLYNAGSVSSVECRHNHFLHLCQVKKNGRNHELAVKDFIYNEKEDEFEERAPSGIA